MYKLEEGLKTVRLHLLLFSLPLLLAGRKTFWGSIQTVHREWLRRTLWLYSNRTYLKVSQAP